MNVILRPAAAADLQAAYRWYERQRAGLGTQFLTTGETTLTAIAANPEAYPVIHRETRRILVRRFPYGIFYRLVAGQVIVVACMHARRHPIRWRRRT